jgi:polysaccharide lyase-like protein
MVPPGGDLGAGGSSMAVGTGGAPPVEPPPVGQQPPPVTPPPVTPPPVTPPPVAAGPDIPCPADAFFCSGFEGAALPDGTRFVIGGDASFANQFALDATQARSGQQSFAIPGPSPGFSYRVLAVPAARQEYWARLFVRVSSEFGDQNHDALFGASNAAITADHNNETVIELSEQFGYMLLNTDDCALACNTPAPELTLAPDAWHCLEAHYNGNTGQVEVFLEGDRFIDATQAAHQVAFQTFRLGYMRFNTERSVWYDDVVLADSRVGCD